MRKKVIKNRTLNDYYFKENEMHHQHSSGKIHTFVFFFIKEVIVDFLIYFF